MIPKKAKLQGEMHGAFVSAKTDITRRVTIPEDQLSDELLWGIPNHVTLKFIATKLPWRAWQVAATLSADWQLAFQGRMVYDARVHWQTTQTFLAVLCDLTLYVKRYDSRHRPNYLGSLQKRTLSLFSPNEKRCFRLPPLPGCQRRWPARQYNYVFLDGAIYNLGGARYAKGRFPSKELHVLDLARQPLEWRQCASMQTQKLDLSKIGVMHGKIFVFAAHFEDGQNEVYDPKVDVWSCIAPMRRWTNVSSVFSVGQHFFVVKGCYSSSPPRNSARMEPRGDEVTGESNSMADLYTETKLVVKDGRRGPWLISTSNDDADDEMDGLHEIIANGLANHDSGRSAVELAEHELDRLCLSFTVSRRYYSFPDRDLASDIDHVEEEGHRWGWYLGVYDPVKDKWTVFERESLGTHHVENTRPEIEFHFDKGKLYGTALVWSMSL